MNIEVSYNWIREYVGFSGSPEEFARKLSLSGPNVERQHPQMAPFENMVVGKVVEVQPHPQADKLRLALTDLGGERPVTIVCGGANLEPGMKVVVALAGAMVRWHGAGDPIRLEPATIRGVKSDGMICAADEIGLEQAFPHAEKEIMDLSWCKAKPGTALGKALELDDIVFDIEVTTNRPDAFSVIGLAREAGAIMHERFSWKESMVPSPAKNATRPPLTVRNKAERLCPRYTAVVMENVDVGPSPWWLKKRLIMSGIRPINNVVDITNYVMLEYGQPMHAFDYDKLADHEITVREATAGERLLALDGKAYELSAGQLVIADAERPVAIAGVMGGEETGVTLATRTVVFESASFDPVHVRRTARALNLRSDSSLRFEKGLPSEQAAFALARAVELVEKVATGHVASDAVDLWPKPPKPVKFPFRPEKAEELIGVCVPRTLMAKILKSLGFTVAKVGEGKTQAFEITVPYWRARDIEGERDFAEEIARIYGYQNVPSIMPDGPLPLQPPDALLRLEADNQVFLAGAGYTELLTYSMLSRAELEQAGENPRKAIAISNPLSADFEFLRLSLRPGTLSAVARNQGLRTGGRVFEQGRVFQPRKEGLPVEAPRLLVTEWTTATDESAFLAVKGALEGLLERVGVAEPLQWSRDVNDAYWHPGRSVIVRAGKQVVATVGEVHPAVAKAFGLDVRVASAEVNLDTLVGLAGIGRAYEPPPAHPPARRDLAVLVPERAEHAAMARVARATSKLLVDIELFDVYRGEAVGDGLKSVAYHLTFAEAGRTLRAEEADQTLEAVLAAWAAEFGAKLR
jgi:phenylalanyl-tRNA synthetase beta chain